MKKTKVFIILFLMTAIVNAQDKEVPSKYSHKGYFNSTNFGLLVGSSNNENKAPFTFMMINGYGITDQFSLGLGIGVDFLSESYLPLVIDARYYFRNQKFSPFAFIQTGYSIPLDQESSEYHLMYPNFSSSSFWSGYDLLKPQGGYLISPGVGLKTMFNDNLGMTFTIAYHFQRLNYDRTTDDRDTALEIDMNRLEVKVGIFFK